MALTQDAHVPGFGHLAQEARFMPPSYPHMPSRQNPHTTTTASGQPHRHAQDWAARGSGRGKAAGATMSAGSMPCSPARRRAQRSRLRSR